MRKLVLLFVLFFAFHGVFAFDVLNSNGDLQSYFSNSNDEVFVKTSLNNTNFTVSFNFSGDLREKSFDLVSCDDSFKCSNFSFDDLLEVGESFSLSNEFLVKIGSEQENIYLDFEKPKLLFSLSQIDEESQKVKFKFNYSDNFDEIKSFEVYVKEGSNLVFILDILGKTSYDYSFEKAGDLNLLFRLKDKAGNILEVEKYFYIDDFTKPKVSKIDFTLRDGEYKIDFEISDENLSRYEISQGTLTFSENIEGDVFSKSLVLPFSSGSIIFKVIDVSGNEFSKEYSLKSNIVNTYPVEYTNEKSYNFLSNANYCSLVSFDLNDDFRNFTESSDVFSLDFNVLENKEYNLEFYCVKDGFTQYFEKSFIYDTKVPSLSQMSILAREDGDLELVWSKSLDDQSEVIYELHRNGEEVYSGSRTKYVDDEVEYPQVYNYFLKIFDRAGNVVQTQNVSLVPKKIEVELSTNLLSDTKSENSFYPLEIVTDENSKLDITVRNLQNVVFSKVILNSSGNEKFDINLSDGVNEVRVFVIDNFGNQKELNYFITYTAPVVVEPEIVEPVINESVREVVVEDVIEEPRVEEVVEDEDDGVSFWTWFLFFIFLLCLFLYVIIFKEDKLKKLMSGFPKKSIRKTKENVIFRNKDYVLKKSLEKIKQERERKQEEKKADVLRKKKEAEHKGLSRFQKAKLKDISERKHDIPIFSRSSSNVKKKRESLYDETLKTKEERYKKDKSSGFFSIFKNKGSAEQNQKDSISSYLENKKSPSWGSTRDYVMKEEEKKQENVETGNNNDQEDRVDMKNFDFKKGSYVNKPSQVAEKKVQEERKEKQEVEEKQENPRKRERLSLDEYLNKRAKKNKSYFTERQVDKDIDSFK